MHVKKIVEIMQQVFSNSQISTNDWNIRKTLRKEIAHKDKHNKRMSL